MSGLRDATLEEALAYCAIQHSDTSRKPTRTYRDICRVLAITSYHKQHYAANYGNHYRQLCMRLHPDNHLENEREHYTDLMECLTNCWGMICNEDLAAIIFVLGARGAYKYNCIHIDVVNLEIKAEIIGSELRTPYRRIRIRRDEDWPMVHDIIESIQANKDRERDERIRSYVKNDDDTLSVTLGNDYYKQVIASNPTGNMRDEGEREEEEEEERVGEEQEELNQQAVMNCNANVKVDPSQGSQERQVYLHYYRDGRPLIEAWEDCEAAEPVFRDIPDWKQ